MPFSERWKASWQLWNRTEKVASEDYIILKAIEAEVKPWWGPIHMIQGGLEESSGVSASTHVGLGAYDISVKNRETGKYRSEETCLRLSAYFLRSGIVPFLRGYEVGSYDDRWDNNRHFHLVSRETYDNMHSSAQAQYREYRDWAAGKDSDGDGLVGRQRFPGPAEPRLERWSTSPYNSANVRPDTKLYHVNVDQGSFLKGLSVDRKVKTALQRGAPVQAVKQVMRWGRANVVTQTETYFALEFLTVEAPPA